MLLAASLLDRIFDASLPVLILELLGAGFAVFGFVSFFKHNNVKAQLTAKDAVIATNQQTIEAFEERLDGLDAKVKYLEGKLDETEGQNAALTLELRDWESKYANLESFAAPALGERLINMFEHQEEVLDKIVNALESIQLRIDTLEDKSV